MFHSISGCFLYKIITKKFFDAFPNLSDRPTERVRHKTYSKLENVTGTHFFLQFLQFVADTYVGLAGITWC